MLQSILDHIDFNAFCEALYITDKEKLRILDYGCNDGALLEAIKPCVMAETMLCGVDANAAAIEAAKAKNIPNSEFFVVEPGEQLPIAMKTTDLCIMSRVFHEVNEQGQVKPVMKEIHRAMQGFGKLAVIEFKKNVKAPFGPPMQTKLSPGALERLIIPEGFKLKETLDLGPYLFMSVFTPMGRADQFNN